MAERFTFDRETRSVHALFDFKVPDREQDAPSLEVCRYAVLRILPAGKEDSQPEPHYADREYFVIFDRILSRVVDGVYWTTRDDMLHLAQSFNRTPPSQPLEPPNGDALGLFYPDSDIDDDKDDERSDSEE